jgi:hypothetical protein
MEVVASRRASRAERIPSAAPVRLVQGIQQDAVAEQRGLQWLVCWVCSVRPNAAPACACSPEDRSQERAHHPRIRFPVSRTAIRQLFGDRSAKLVAQIQPHVPSGIDATCSKRESAVWTSMVLNYQR